MKAPQTVLMIAFFVLLQVAIVILVLKAFYGLKAKMKAAADAFAREAENRGDRVVLRDDGAVCRGFRSGMRVRLKGNGSLLLTGSGLHFIPIFGDRRDLGWDEVRNPRISSKAGASLVLPKAFVLDYESGEEKGEVGWVVKEPGKWADAISAALKVRGINGTEAEPAAPSRA